MMIRFVYNVPEEHAQYTGIKTIDIELQDESTLDEMIDAYSQFLKACGYEWDQNCSLQIAPNEV